MPPAQTPAPLRHGLVLTAGLGTRLRPLTYVRAKPAIPVAGEALIRRIIRQLVAGGVIDLVLNLHYLPETIAAVVGDGHDLGARVRYSWERPLVLGSAGGPRLALDLIQADTFFIVNGDTVADVDLQALAARHRASGADVTLALTPNREPDRYGGVLLDKDGRVTGFLRRGVATAPSYHFVGVQVVNAAVFRPLPAGTPASTIGGVYDALIADRPDAVRGVVSEARFWDVGTVDSYVATSRAFADGGRAEIGRRSTIAPDADVSGSIVWDDVTIGAGATVVDCVVADGVAIAPGARFVRTILRLGPEGQLLADPFPGAHE